MTAGRPYPGIELRHSAPPAIGEAVLAVQQRLGELGMACADIRDAALPRTRTGTPAGDIAGLFGIRTAAATRRYQGQRGLRIDGIIGPITWDALWGTPAQPGTQLGTQPSGPAIVLRSSAPSGIRPDARNTDLAELHPVARARVLATLDGLKAEGIPMKVFEAFRTPERQQFLFAKGRNAVGEVVDKSAVVTQARPFESYHQYGLAADIVIDSPGMNPWDTGSAETRGWWAALHRIARSNGMEPLSWEMPHVQVAGLSPTVLLRGEYPGGGDASWADNLEQAIARWPGSRKPPAPSGPASSSQTRPPLATLPIGPNAVEADGLDWNSLPQVAATTLGNPFGGQRWRVDEHGVHVEGQPTPQRTDGAPKTCGAILERLGPLIHRYSLKHQVPAEHIVMTIATETGRWLDDGFTGPGTFRWEPGVTDYSAGPMQMLSRTAREVSQQNGLGYDDDRFPQFASHPAPTPDDLPMYNPDIAIDLGTARMRQLIARNGPDPLLVAAAYNAGSLRASNDNPWGIHCFGDHLDRAAQWFGDACEVVGRMRR